MNIQAIQTNFDGHRFRSRLEARWAVFFKAHNIPYLYEPEGYVVDGKPYLPDFLLTDCGTWVEVKGQEAELDKDFLGTASAKLPLIQSGRKYAEEGPRLIVLGQIPDPILSLLGLSTHLTRVESASIDTTRTIVLGLSVMIPSMEMILFLGCKLAMDKRNLMRSVLLLLLEPKPLDLNMEKRDEDPF